jgi:hypothetical protein
VRKNWTFGSHAKTPRVVRPRRRYAKPRLSANHRCHERQFLFNGLRLRSLVESIAPMITRRQCLAPWRRSRSMKRVDIAWRTNATRLARLLEAELTVRKSLAKTPQGPFERPNKLEIRRLLRSDPRSDPARRHTILATSELGRKY